MIVPVKVEENVARVTARNSDTRYLLSVAGSAIGDLHDADIHASVSHL